MTSIDEALPAMQELASRLWSPESRHHPGQLAWSARYALPEELDHGPVELFRDRHGRVVGWAWVESPDWLELCVDPGRPDVVDDAVAWFLDVGVGETLRTMVLEAEQHLLAGLAQAGFRLEDQPWFTHHHLDLARLADVPVVAGYRFRHVEPEEADRRAACHRAAWSPPGGSSRVSTAAYRRLMATPPYRPDLDWVAVDADGVMVASCLAWLDPRTGVALVEPVGCAPEHRGRGLAEAVSLAALHAARRSGGTTGLVCPRGDDGYPAPQRIYRRMGFEPGARTLTLARPGGLGPDGS
jgi:GNAT superfamily N-acetyltransferase